MDAQTQAIDLTQAFTDVPYIEPSTIDPNNVSGHSGNIGNLVVTPTGVQAGLGDQRVGYDGTKNNEMVYVGDKDDPFVILGQLFSKTGIYEYGLWTNVGYFTGTVTAADGEIGGWAIGPTTLSSANIIIDSNNQNIRSSDYVAGISGFLISKDLVEAENIKARGSLHGVSFQYDVVSAVGGQLMVSNSDTLNADMTALDASTLTTSANTALAVNDILLVRAVTGAGVQEEWMRVTNIASAPIYSVTRDLAGVYASNNNPAWPKGTTIVQQGKSDGVSTYSGGWLRLIGQGTNSPYYSVFQRNGVTYNSYSEVARFGNLNGIGGFVADTFGVFVGNASTGNYMQYDTASGNLIVNGRQFTTDPVYGDGSDGDVVLGAGTTTLTRDMFYNNLTIPNGAILNPAGYKIFCKTKILGQSGGSFIGQGNAGGAATGGANGSGGTGGTFGSAGAASTALASGSLFGALAGPAGKNGSTGGSGAGGAATGGAGGAGVAGAAGIAQSACLGSTGAAGAAGGAGATGGSGNGFAGGAGGAAGGAGAAGTKTAAQASFRNIGNALLMVDTITVASYTTSSGNGGAGSGGGGGGGGGGTPGSTQGGGGGGGGGSGGAGTHGRIGFIAARTIQFDAGFSINFSGGNGGNGGNGAPAPQPNGGGGSGGGGGAGGAGGDGGILVYIYTTYTNNATTTVAGGTRGNAGTGGTGGAGNGTGSAGSSGSTASTANNGSSGIILQLQIL